MNEDKRGLNQQLRELQERYEKRIRDLEATGEDTEQHYIKLLEEKRVELQDITLQHEAMEKQFKSNRQFLEVTNISITLSHQML